ncbi:hypothetical protein DFH07DRAFT_959380 [Mycena maculata]|uniref:Transmembrane protein n=1 Tax=Mycena maculata TaxID=230809 RepID=A0AAD7NDK1_9AGAR|nr:hypothetical protein DFH07DRAFT_959380 [Mycena maculata]
MPAILLALQSRASRFRFSSIQCYNENDQPIQCPMTKADRILLYVALGLFLFICISACLAKNGCCGCGCRRRRKSPTVPTSVPYPAGDAEFKFKLAGPPDYRHFGIAYPDSTETLVEPDKIHPALHPYHHY